MATQISGIIKVESICYDLIDRMDLDRSSVRKIFSYLVEGYRELNTYHLSNQVFEKKTIPSTGILDFPSDCVFVNNVFMPVDGEMKPLSRKNDIVRTTTIVNGTEIREGSDGEGVQSGVRKKGEQRNG